jgi:hypothetical protein
MCRLQVRVLQYGSGHILFISSPTLPGVSLRATAEIWRQTSCGLFASTSFQY